MRNLRSSIDDGNAHAGHMHSGSINEEEVPLVPLNARRDDNNNKHTRVSSHLDDNGDEDDLDAQGWELDDFTSNTSRDSLTLGEDTHTAADYDLVTASSSSSSRRNGRVRLADEEKDAGIDGGKVDDPALAMVKAVVPETDDPSLPNLTFRVLVLGSILCGVGAAISQLFFVSSLRHHGMLLGN